MTKQPLPYRKLFINNNREPYDLANILRNKDNKIQRVLLDIDGTLHRGIHFGLYEKFLRGITNADLAFHLLWNISYSQRPKFLYDCLKIFLYDRKTLANGVADKEREQHSRYLINLFFESLEQISEHHIRFCASKLPHMMYPDAKETLEKIEGRRALISCSLQVIVDAYGEHLNIKDCYGNNRSATQNGNIYSAADKERIANIISSRAERIIVAGDTTDDIGMANVAHEKNSQSIVLAMHHRSEALESKADIIAYSWKDLRAFLEEF